MPAGRGIRGLVYVESYTYTLCVVSVLHTVCSKSVLLHTVSTQVCVATPAPGSWGSNLGTFPSASATLVANIKIVRHESLVNAKWGKNFVKML